MVKSYCQLLTVKYVMYFKMNPNDEKFDWFFRLGIVETHQFLENILIAG